MITVKSIIKESLKNSDGKVNVKIRITQNRKSRLIGTEHYITPNYFDSEKGRIKKSHPYSEYINAELDKLELDYRKKLLLIENRHTLDIITLTEMLKEEKTVFDYNIYTHFKLISEDFKKKKSNTFRHYEAAANSIKRYKKGDFLDIRNVDTKFLRDYTSFYYSRGKTTNGIGVDLRCIRAVFNRLINDGKLGLEYYPFRKFKIEKRETVKRSLTLAQLKELFKLELSGKELYARDIFFLSFFLIGMNIYDMYQLKQENIVNGRVEYRRAKTHKLYSIKIEEEAKEILDLHLGDYRKIYTTPEQFKKSTNKFLRKIGKTVKLPHNLTSYFARHTWATLASRNGISRDDIAAGLGHGTKTVTDIYIDFDRDRIDKANRKVIDLLVKD